MPSKCKYIAKADGFPTRLSDKTMHVTSVTGGHDNLTSQVQGCIFNCFRRFRHHHTPRNFLHYWEDRAGVVPDCAVLPNLQ